MGLFCDVSGQYSSEYVYKYSWLAQTIYQLLGWIMIATTAFLLSSFAWLLIGNFLFWREQIAHGKVDKDIDFSLGVILSNFVNSGCRGIRVSPELERIGSDNFFEQI